MSTQSKDKTRGIRTVLIGDFTGTPDEGMKNVTATLGRLLAARNPVFLMNPGQALSLAHLIRLHLFAPHIIHYLHGPTIRSLILLKILKAVTGAATMVSATRPYLSDRDRKFFGLVKPDLVLTQSSSFEAFCKRRRVDVQFFPNGADIEKFTPQVPGEKTELRRQLNLPLGKKIILHVGHIKKNRQLDVFLDIQKIKGIQVVIAGGTHETADKRLKEQLKEAGIRVIHKFMPDISMLYNASDLYVFPIVDQGQRETAGYNTLGAIDLPLSVIEAMACNLPVLSTPFGALPRLFKPGQGLEWAKGPDQILEKVKQLPEGESTTRQQVLPLAWPKMIQNLEHIYQGLVFSGPRASSLWANRRINDEF